ncbi:MAG: patatin-like phospholipase family protein [Synechococcus sp. SB0668_bin_13]|nr:patatin-like phospholipase family protein [Synechococcus sp. SB0668_bin_13]
MTEATVQNGTCRILCLDGGGAKGFYTLGVLREVEALLSQPIYESFDLIFGTSTGSIIAALLSLGHGVETIHEAYKMHVPMIMRAEGKRSKSEALRLAGMQVFGDVRFDAVKTGLGIVSAKWQLETPMIFKSRKTQAHGRQATFVPGFGCTVAEAVEASCSAYPFFDRKIVTTSSGDNVELMDGGYCANNPTLYAIADATASLGFSQSNCRVLSIGCGQYPEPQSWIKRMKKRFWLVQLLQKTLEINTSSMDQLCRVLFPNVPTIRVSDSFNKPEMATDMFEHDLGKLNLLRQQGAESFGRREHAIVKLLLDVE